MRRVAVVVVATAALLAACTGDDDPTAAVPVTEVAVPESTSTVPPRRPAVMPTTDDGTTALRADQTYPSLGVAERRSIALVPPDPSTAGDTIPRLEFTPDGSLLVLDVVAHTANAYGVDGAVRWSVPVPADVDGRRPYLMELGPDQVLWLSYLRDADTTFSIVAVATAGERGGQVIGTWPQGGTCTEGFCGDLVLGADGVRLSGVGDVAPVPYVDRTGAASPAGFTPAAPPAVTTEPGPALPADWVPEDEFGNTLTSARVTVTSLDRSWVFDLVGVRQAPGGAAPSFAAQPDGSVVSAVALTADAHDAGTLVWVDLLPDGSVSAFTMPDEARAFAAAAVIDGQRWVAVLQPTGIDLVRLTSS
jgi:hypothetical protein